MVDLALIFVLQYYSFLRHKSSYGHFNRSCHLGPKESNRILRRIFAFLMPKKRKKLEIIVVVSVCTLEKHRALEYS